MICYITFDAVPPIITIPPEHQTLRVGDSITLECEADGFPTPQIDWMRDGRPISVSQRISFETDNTELIIEHIKESDAGKSVVIISHGFLPSAFTDE